MDVGKFVTYAFLAAIAVLVVTHAVGATQVITAGGGQTTNFFKTFTGAGISSGTTGSVSSNGTRYSISG
jgi:hypothetical protein